MSINDLTTGETIRRATDEEAARYLALDEDGTEQGRCPDTGACDGGLIADDLEGLAVWLD